MKQMLVFLLLIGISSVALAETISFKDGKSVKAKVLQKDSQSIKVDLNGVTVTYYLDEIKDIDGVALVAPIVPVIEATQIKIPVVPKKEDPYEKRALILKFIDVFGTRKAMTRNFDTILNSISEQKPQEVLKIREKFKVEEVIERIIPLYDKYFTSEELKFYIEFYSSPKGQKLILNIAGVMKDSVDVGTNYLKEKLPEMMENK